VPHDPERARTREKGQQSAVVRLVARVARC
jgi:hypothetical protein